MQLRHVVLVYEINATYLKTKMHEAQHLQRLMALLGWNEFANKALVLGRG